jgi:hypothetical protein
MSTDDESSEEVKLVQDFNAISLASSTDNNPSTSTSTSCFADKDRRVIILDAGYGFPREKKVRKEKINAIASQLSNFLIWQTNHHQHQQQQQQKETDIRNEKETTRPYQYANVRVVGCPDENIKTILENRTIENMKKVVSSTSVLPPHVTVTCETLEQCLKDLAELMNQRLQYLNDDDGDGDGEGDSDDENDISDTTNDEAIGHDITTPVYLSPDADESLKPSSEPPRIIIIGLLIDRRVQPNRSRDRANNLDIITRRWPLEECFKDIDACEPLNVDCILEGTQQWWWNWSCSSFKSANINKGSNEAFAQAATQAIEHHAERHPSRPLHITKRP